MVSQHLNSVKRVIASYKPSYPTPLQYAASVTTLYDDNNDATVVMSNTSSTTSNPPQHALGMSIGPLLAIADTGTTSYFLTRDAPCQNKRLTNSPLTITLPDGQKIKSTHVCDITIPRLPTIIMGHIMPNMTTASLFGIRVLCKAGCKVLFNNDKCQVIYNGKVILTGYKDLASNPWTLPILPVATPWTTLDAPHQSPLGHCMSDAPLHHTAIFLYHQTTKENNVKFMHQSLCNFPKSSLLAAICQGFLRGAPHLSKKAVYKYLPPSPATSKGHMKQPRKGIPSTTPKPPRISIPIPILDAIMPGLIEPPEYNKDKASDVDPLYNIIDNIDDHLTANVFCFGAFANKIFTVVYDDCTGKFPFVSLDGNICFFVMYHYKTNAILATPIHGLNSGSILKAYKKNCEYLKNKGYKPKLNVMDNQATKVIKTYLTPQQMSLQLISDLKGQFRCSKIDSSARLARPTPISHPIVG